VAIDIYDTMARLSEVRPLFHSEADFQHALAWQLQQRYPHLSIRLEYRSPHLPQRWYVDLWLADGNEHVALELKYKTRALRKRINNEEFDLLDQAAQDIGRYDTLKDVYRVEQIVGAMPHSVGFVLLLTNDSSYWTTGTRAGSVDKDFRLHDGRTVLGELAWGADASPGTRKRREASLLLSGTYQVNWHDYGPVHEGRYGRFRYMLVNVARTT
jgi:hypothetical protein